MYLQAEPDSMEKASDEMLVHTVPPHGSYLLQVQADTMAPPTCAVHSSYFSITYLIITLEPSRGLKL